MHIYIYIYIYKVSKIGNCCQGQPEGFLLISYYTICKGGCYSFPWITPLYPRAIPYNAEC